jgi:hypothetical protein
MDIVVHTLEARDNFLLQFMQDRFNLTDAAVGHLIVDALTRTTDALAVRGVEYAALQAALTPSADQTEVALIFDIERISNNWYGREVFGAFLPLLGHGGSHSILHGDIIEPHGQAVSWLSIHLRPSRRYTDSLRKTALCCIYLNNCSPAAVSRLHDGLGAYPPYLGYVDMTHGSTFKTLLSLTLSKACVQHRGVVIQPHEDDLPADANQNTLSYPFEKAGFACRSIPEMYFGLLLSYKIERPVLDGDERDQVMSLAAVSSEPVDIADCAVEIDDRKFQYLVEQKTGSLKRIGILGEPKVTLETLIRRKLRSQYLYRLRFRPDHQFVGFNLMLELEAIDTGDPVRVVAAFAYENERRAIRLITLF